MDTQSSQTVLLSLVGTTPAVLTETVWALAHKAEPVIPDRVVAVTTAAGRQTLTARLFEGGKWEAMKADLAASGREVSGKLRFGPIADSIRVFPDATRSRELDDIRTVEENEAVAEFLMEVVRGFTENDSIQLIVSIAGGRKTTSALLHSVMTLLGRAQDTITHVIVDDCWVRSPDFFYPGCSGEFTDPSTGGAMDCSQARLDLAEVPFIPLRYLFKRDLQKSAGSYLQLMRELRTRTLNVDDDLAIKLEISTAEVTINEKLIRFSPNDFLFYLFFAERAVAGDSAVESYSAIGDELQSLRQRHLQTDNFNHWSQKALQGSFDPSEDLRKWASSIRRQLKVAGFDSFQIDRLVPRRGYLAIEVPPENITIT